MHILIGFYVNFLDTTRVFNEKNTDNKKIWSINLSSQQYASSNIKSVHCDV